MRVDCALLCDAVTVREGLLHILGGGVTRATRQSYPGPLGLSLALRVLIHPTEAADIHKMEVILQDADGQRVAGADVEFGLSDTAGLAPGEHGSLPVALSFPEGVQLPAPGTYSFELLIDGVHQVSVPFIAIEEER